MRWVGIFLHAPVNLGKMMMETVQTGKTDQTAPQTKKAQRGQVFIYGKWCKGCQICVTFCPTGVLAMDGSGEHPLVAQRPPLAQPPASARGSAPRPQRLPPAPHPASLFRAPPAWLHPWSPAPAIFAYASPPPAIRSSTPSKKRHAKWLALPRDTCSSRTSIVL